MTETKFQTEEYRAEHRVYQAQRRANLAGRFCDCGNPAVICKSGEFICERCARFERMMYAQQHDRGLSGKPGRAVQLGLASDAHHARKLARQVMEPYRVSSAI